MIEIGSHWQKRDSSAIATVLEVTEYYVKFEIVWPATDDLPAESLVLSHPRILFEAYFVPVTRG